MSATSSYTDVRGRNDIERLQTIERELGAYLATLRDIAEEDGLGGQFERDHEVFREQFLRIYGEAA